MAGVLAACSVLVLAVLGLGPHTGRYQVVTILSGSMGATAPAGAVALSTPLPTGAVRVGDVITYSIPVEDRRLVTHRVVEVVERGDAPVIRTKGDANEAADPWMARLDPGVAWKVRFSVPHLGYGVSFLRRPAMQTLLVRTIPFLVALLWLREIWGWSARRPRRTWRLRPPRRWTPAAARASVLCVALAGPLIIGRQALGGFSAARTAAPSLASGTLQPPSGFSATGGCGLLILGPKAALSWTVTPSTWADGYRIERWRTGTLQATYVVPGRNTNGYEVTGLSGNTTYTFRLYAYRNGWTSSSVEDAASTPPLCL